MAENVIDLKPKTTTDGGGPFVTGSTVKLKSGGAVMTVNKPGKASVTVEWHNANDDPISASYHPSMLRHADPNEEEKGKNTDGGG